MYSVCTRQPLYPLSAIQPNRPNNPGTIHYLCWQTTTHPSMGMLWAATSNEKMRPSINIKDHALGLFFIVVLHIFSMYVGRPTGSNQIAGRLRKYRPFIVRSLWIYFIVDG